MSEIDATDLSEAAQSTFARHVRSGTAESGDISSQFWTDPIRKLNPIRVYKHRANVVVVLKQSDELEEGLYIYIPVSSYLPRSGDDHFTFTNIAGGVYQFRRKNNK